MHRHNFAFQKVETCGLFQKLAPYELSSAGLLNGGQFFFCQKKKNTANLISHPFWISQPAPSPKIIYQDAALALTLKLFDQKRVNMYWSSMGPGRRKNNPVAIASPTFHCASGTRSFALTRAIWGKAALQCISARGKHTLVASACAAHLDLIWLPGATPVKNRRFHAQNWIVYDMMWYDMIWYDMVF